MQVAPDIRLDADGLAMRYGHRILFRDLSLSVESGEALAITGINGSGKTTLIRILTGLTAPTRGAVALTISGIRIPDEDRPMHTGFAGPYLGLYGDLTAFETLAFICQARGLDTPLAVDNALERVGLSDRAHDPVRAFSSGMQQRLRLATALIASPGLLILDEPGATLDLAGREMVADLVASHIGAGGALVLATNDPSEGALCDRYVEL